MTYTVLTADVTAVTPAIVTVILTSGPRTGQKVYLPRSACADPTLITIGDDELEVATWLSTKEGLV